MVSLEGCQSHLERYPGQTGESGGMSTSPGTLTLLTGESEGVSMSPGALSLLTGESVWMSTSPGTLSRGNW